MVACIHGQEDTAVLRLPRCLSLCHTIDVKYSAVIIIFNPHSTGPSELYAKRLQRELHKLYPDLKVELKPTKYAGHAEKLAYRSAKASKNPLIISSSGDGGYNEVINGAMRAQAEGATPVCAVLAAGNANDHERTLQDRPLIDAIKDGKERTLDLLKAQYKTRGQEKVRYAHSYIGLGLTPVVAVELNKTSLNALKELWIVLKTFYKFRPFKIKVKGLRQTLDSIIFTNIGEMAKVLTVAKNAKPDDGVFEIVTFPHSAKARLIRRLAKASAGGLQQTKRAEKYNFTVLKKMPVQFDGEVQFIDKNSQVQITSEHRILRTIL
jgi:diacylglycerol kinase (ATP)